MENIEKYITIDPNIRFGRPTIKGTRITVYDVLNWFSQGMTIEEVLSDFPELSEEQIRGCFAFAAKREQKLVAV